MDYIKEPHEVEKALEKLSNTSKATYGLDIETNGLDPFTNDILLIQIGNDEVQVVFDVYRCGSAIMMVIDWLKSTKTTKVLHNSKFDLSFLRYKFKALIPNCKCTYIAEQLLTKGKNVKLNLGAVLEKYIYVRLDKSKQTSFVGMPYGSEFDEDQVLYAAKDIQYMPKLYKKISQRLKDKGLQEIANLEYNTVYPTVEMELNGIYLDKKRWSDLADTAKKKLDQAEERLDAYFSSIEVNNTLFGNPDINYASPEQIKTALEQLLQTELPDTGEATISKIDHPVAQAVLDYRKHYKRYTTYGEQFAEKHISSVTGRVHSRFKQLGADTGRYASKDPNLQNIPGVKEYRAAFRAQNSNYKIIAADFSNQELRLLAKISEDPTFRHAIDTGRDLHCMAASLLFDVPYEDFFDESGNMIPEMKKKYRTPAKRLNFGLIYGMGPGALSASLDIDYREASNLMNKYFQKFPSIDVCLQEFEAQVLETHIARSPLDGRMVDLSAIDWDNPKHVAHAKNQAKNLPFQGAGASVTKLALCKIMREIQKNDYDAKLLVTVHDEILLEVHKDEVEEVKVMMENEMISAFNKYAPEIKMEVDANVADYWVKD